MSSETSPRIAGRIRLLPTALAEQIAAGEVVERPGSVVKELVENSLDAGARKIEVTLDAGGRRLIRIVDDGCGMTPEEAQLALLRHATSKITSADDLWSLRTFGFRGEALPSIASVSRFVLATKVPGALSGIRVALEGGRQSEAREHGMPDGTHIEVRDLFFNVPARLKFLKTEATEAGNVTDTLLRLSLANPGVHVRLRSNDRMVLDLPPVDGFAERVRTALGRRGTGALHETVGEENGVKVHAFLAAPEEASSTPRNTFLFVAKRAVRDRALISALAMGYGDLLDKGRYPLAALFLELPGQDLDVNVHPQKLEVRFAHAQEVYAAVRHVVATGVASAPWLSARRPFSLPMRGQPFGHELADEPDPVALPGAYGAGGAPSASRDASAAAPAAWSMDAAGRAAARGGVGRPWQRSQPEAKSDGASPAFAGDPSFVSQLTYVGQLHGTYLVCEAPGEMVLVDQHAACERLAFLRLRKAYEDGNVVTHRLLFPIEIEVDESGVAIALSPAAQSELTLLGFEVDGFASRRLLVRGVPEMLKEASVKPLLLDVLAALGKAHGEQAPDDLLATLVAHGCDRGGDKLERGEAVDLLAAFDDTDFRSHCPHGRPLAVRIPLSELERRFERR